VTVSRRPAHSFLQNCSPRQHVQSRISFEIRPSRTTTFAPCQTRFALKWFGWVRTEVAVDGREQRFGFRQAQRHVAHIEVLHVVRALQVLPHVPARPSSRSAIALVYSRIPYHSTNLCQRVWIRVKKLELGYPHWSSELDFSRLSSVPPLAKHSRTCGLSWCPQNRSWFVLCFSTGDFGISMVVTSPD
jgi:hypothetical protein